MLRRSVSWFRLFHSGLIILSWCALGYMARHRSVQPAIFGRYSWRYFFFLACGVIAAALLTITLRRSISDQLYAARKQMLISSLLGVALVSGAVEIAVRRWDIFGMSLFDEVERYMGDLIPDSRLSFRQQAGIRKTYQGVEIATNEIGLRDRSLSPKSHARHRILLLGDSVTLGWGVPIEDTYGRRIEVEFERLGRPVETVNAGVSGYNTVQELEFLKLRGSEIAPDTVTVLFVENDVEPVISLPRDRRSLWQGPLYWPARSRAFRFAYVMIPGYLGYRTPSSPNGEPWQQSIRALGEIEVYCQAREISFVTFLYRQRPTPQTDRIWSDISRVASQMGFEAYDAAPWFQGADLLSMVNSRVDVHPNARGHQLLASGISKALARHLSRPSVSAARR